LGILGDYHDSILDTHNYLALNDKLQFHPNTRGALKHPAWDRLLDTTPEGWMEFYKSICHNCMPFGIAIIPFEAFVIQYHDKGHGLCVCNLGGTGYQRMGAALYSVL
jgi:hypothetical protein